MQWRKEFQQACKRIEPALAEGSILETRGHPERSSNPERRAPGQRAKLGRQND